MYRAIASLFIVTGCGFQTPNPLRDAGGDPDVPIDMPIDMPPDMTTSACVGRFLEACPTRTLGDVTFGTATTLNTDTDARCEYTSGTPSLCVIFGNTITISAAVTVIGSRALVFAAFNSVGITPSGSLSLSSKRGMPAGAGANDPACGTPTEGSDGMAGGGMGAGGGAGGSFGGVGGGGGTGGATTGGMAASALATPTRVTGGCKGSKGGNTNVTLGGAPGNGGGAIMLIARNNINVNGAITAAGAGGGATGPFTGGGGGGSGGFIGFDAANYTIGATVTVSANGGGGAAVAAAGDDGASSVTMAAAGGMSAGGDGGIGSVGATKIGGPGGNDGDGGGGGGGSTGVILFKTTTSATGLFSPTPTIVP